MSEIAGAWIDWGLDPDTDVRILWIPAPTATVTVQDILDTLRALGDAVAALDKPGLVSPKTGGEQELDTGKYVALTVVGTMIQVAFEPRTSPDETGTVTTGSANGTQLHDSAADFSGINRGAIITNKADGSRASVTRVQNSNFIHCTALVGGTDNQFEIGDEYDIVNIVRCEIAGGNWVVVDYLGDKMDGILPTFGTHVEYAKDVSATISEVGVPSPISPSDVADAVWDEPAADHVAANSIGAVIDLLHTLQDGDLIVESGNPGTLIAKTAAGVEVKRWNLKGPTGGAVDLPDGYPAQRLNIP